MATKVNSQNAEHNEIDDEKLQAQAKVVQINAASVALAAAVAAQKPKLLSKNMIQLYAIMAVGYLVSTMNGFDSSLMGSVNAMIPYQESFGLSGAGQSRSSDSKSSKLKTPRLIYWSRLHHL
jgi:hypothetical protein